MKKGDDAGRLARLLAEFPLRPIGDRVAVLPDAPPERSPGGLWLPQQGPGRERTGRGLVLAAGPGAVGPDGRRVPVEVRPGDQVVYSRHAGSDVEVGGETLILLRAHDVHAVYEPGHA